MGWEPACAPARLRGAAGRVGRRWSPAVRCAALIMRRVTPGSSRQNAETEVNHYLETKEGSLHPN